MTRKDTLKYWTAERVTYPGSTQKHFQYYPWSAWMLEMVFESGKVGARFATLDQCAAYAKDPKNWPMIFDPASVTDNGTRSAD